MAEVMRDFLLEQGVAQSDILMERRSRTTYENATHTARLLQQQGVDRVVLVTTATHLFRSELCFKAQGLDVRVSGCQYRATEFDWRLSDLLPGPGAAEDVQCVVHEWLGVLWYWGHGRIWHSSESPHGMAGGWRGLLSLSWGLIGVVGGLLRPGYVISGGTQ